MDIKFKSNIFYRCSELFEALGRFIKKSVTKICRKLFAVLMKAIKPSIKDDVLQITFNYHDNSYNSAQGSYHSVELPQSKSASDGSKFSYYDCSYVDLARELDFDFSSATLFVPVSQLRSTLAHIKDIFKLSLYNFLNYLKYDVFDQVRLSAW